MKIKAFSSPSVNQILRLMSFMKKRIWLYLGSMIGMALVFAMCLNLVVAAKSKTLFDAAVAGNMSLVRSTAAEMAISLLAACILCPLFSYGIFYCIQKTMAEIRVAAFKHIEELPMSYFDKNHSGEVMSYLNNDLNVLENAYFWPIFMTVLSVIMGIGCTGVMFYLSWEIAVCTILIGIITSYVNARFARPIRAVSDEIQKHLGSVAERLTDLLSGFHVVKMFGMGGTLGKGYNKKNKELTDAAVRLGRINAALEGSNCLLSNLSALGVFILGAVLIAYSGLSIGTAIACTQLYGGIGFMFGQLGGFIAQMQRSLAGASRVFRLLDEEPEASAPAGEAHGREGMVRFENVTFTYDNENNILEGVSFSVPEGKSAALIGHSGSGKSTIMKLLMGFYRHSGGLIHINGRSIDSYTLEELRGLTAYVPQDAYLFQGTIEENIRMGKENASREEVVSAAKAAYAHAFIMELPEGYDSLVGEQGARLSGGQRQRIAIARALIKDAPILLLDEATSALDSESEQHVQEALKELMKGRTVIVIAHRLSTIEHAGMILVLENGKIAEQGKHKELMASGGIYNNLYELQFS